MSAVQSVTADRIILVEQLTAGQWDAFDPNTRWRTAVTTWPDAVSMALWAALLTRSGVQSVSLNGDRLLLLHPPVSV